MQDGQAGLHTQGRRGSTHAGRTKSGGYSCRADRGGTHVGRTERYSCRGRTKFGLHTWGGQSGGVRTLDGQRVGATHTGRTRGATQ